MTTFMKCSSGKMFHFVYKTTNLVNKLFYIGVHSTTDLDDGYLGSGFLISAAIKKYGRSQFKRDILRFFEQRSDAYAFEATLVTEALIKSRKSYNRAVGGNGGHLGEAVAKKISLTKQGSTPWNKGFYRAARCSCGKPVSDYCKLCRQCYVSKNTHAGENNPAFKGWYLTPVGKFASLKIAAKEVGVPPSTLRRWCLANRPNFGFQPKL